MKKTITTITLAVVMTLGATFANANTGIIVAGSPEPAPCTKSTDGIIVAGRADTLPGLIGTVVSEIMGIIVAGSPETDPCTGTVETDGIIVAG